ncbi:MAG TPA: hypothetical protein VLC47_09310 [Burkholderiales bacterium]|nr:hypothetical protein [Burkholderiales bacterium]
MTELLFRDDPYRRSTAAIGSAVVLKIRSGGKCSKHVTIGFAGEATDA